MEEDKIESSHTFNVDIISDISIPGRSLHSGNSQRFKLDAESLRKLPNKLTAIYGGLIALAICHRSTGLLMRLYALSTRRLPLFTELYLSSKDSVD